MTTGTPKLTNRIVIANDESGAWYIRRIRVVEHALDRDEKVYRCDWPVGGRYASLEEALTVAKQFLGIDGEEQKR
jgi:hypothetical protein